MEVQTLAAQMRESSGKGFARRARVAGRVPGVVYGGEGNPLSVEVDRKTFETLIHGRMGEHAIVKLEVDGKPELNTAVLLKDVQHHAVSGKVLHADFMRIDLAQRIQTIVPVNLVGRAKGLLEGGVVEQPLREIEIECLATEVPDAIDVDITNLGLNEGLHVSDITPPANVTILTESDRTVVGVLAPRAVTEAAEAAPVVAEAAAPEAGKS